MMDGYKRNPSLCDPLSGHQLLNFGEWELMAFF